MLITKEFIDFVRDHINDDPCKLRLKTFKSALFDTGFAVDQIEARKKTRTKLPELNSNPGFIYPSVLSAEQATCEDVAKYKRNLFLDKYHTLCDLTGGLGVDTLLFSDVVSKVTYIERFEKYCDVAKYNFTLFDKQNINIINADCEEFINNITESFDAFYIDPARRGESDRRLFAFADCEPDVLKLIPNLFTLSNDVWIKSSPMVDILQAISELVYVCEIHVISVKNECKELLFKLNKMCCGENPLIKCADIYSEGCSVFEFHLNDERFMSDAQISTPLSYLYEPSAPILKAGAFKSIAARYNIFKLHKNSHLYTSTEYVANFMGRKFTIEDIIPFRSSNISNIRKLYPFANITVRNFPINAETLRTKLKISSGGDVYLFATKCASNDNVILVCRKAIF
ncbi:MAG: SAM-dependent methyltransferase [Bacteroidales bacterium]